MPLVSIIIVTYNAGEKVIKTLESVFLQVYTNYEVIVIDGGSKDKTLEYILSFKDRIAYFVTEPDKGIYDAMNKGIFKAHGDFCLFLNVGDVFYDENSLLLASEILQKNSNIGIFVGNAVYDYRGIGQYNFSPQFKSLPYSFCHQSMFFRTNVIRVLYYDINYKLSGDSELLYRLIQNDVKLLTFDVILVREEAGDGITFKNLYSSAKELYSIPYLRDHISKSRIAFNLQKIRIYGLLLKILPPSFVFFITQKCKHA